MYYILLKKRNGDVTFTETDRLLSFRELLKMFLDYDIKSLLLLNAHCECVDSIEITDLEKEYIHSNTSLAFEHWLEELVYE